MGRLADLDADLHELPDIEKARQEALETLQNRRAFVLGFEAGEAAEQERIVKVLNGMVDVYLLEKLLVEAAVVANAIAYIKEKND